MKKNFFTSIITTLICVHATCSLAKVRTPAQNPVAKANLRPVTVDEARESSPRSIRLEAYKLGTFSLECNLPDGNLVEIAPVSDQSEFTFLAIKSKKGPLIVANEDFIKRREIQYAVFSFYRECAMHTVTRVQAIRPDDGDLYSKVVVKAAECLAVIPTKKTLGISQTLALYRISDRLRDEYGVGASTRADLQRCENADNVKKMIETLPRNR